MSSALQTFTVPPYRKPQAIEQFRLYAAEIVLAPTRLKKDGVFVMLLHAHEFSAWDTFKLIVFMKETSTHFRPFKPAGGHADNGSFYMVARGVDTENWKCKAIIEHWKKLWESATLDCADDKMYEMMADQITPTKEQVDK
jgi:hypothetical protein